MSEVIDIQDPYWFSDDEQLDEPEVYEVPGYMFENDEFYPLGCSCACECCGCNLLCDESQFMLEDEEEDD